VAKGKSWGVANEWYAASTVAKERKRSSELTGVLHRVCGLLGVGNDIDKLSEWCAEEERKRMNPKHHNDPEDPQREEKA